MELNHETHLKNKKSTNSKLVLRNNDGEIVRYFNWNGESASIVRRKDNRRLEILNDLSYFEDQKIEFIQLGKVNGDRFESMTANTQNKKKSTQLEIGQNSYLALVPQIETHLKNEEMTIEKQKQWTAILSTVVMFFIGSSFLLKLAPPTTAKMEEELKQQVVKIVKNIRREVPVSKTQVMKTEEVQKENVNAKVSPTKIAGLKRMGALSVLGSLKSGKNKGGLDISAAQSSAGAGMGGGTEGSGGVQSSLYAKGITSSALGVGNNVNGAGGYGTKGKGGGQAGYGKMAITGATGAKLTQLGSEATIAVGLDRDQIAAVITRNQGQITYCYEQGLKDTPGISGRVGIDFVIGGTGMVKSAKINSTSLNSKQVEECMMMRLKTWKFPVPEGGVDVQVNYPFKLERAG